MVQAFTWFGESIFFLNRKAKYGFLKLIIKDDNYPTNMADHHEFYKANTQKQQF